MHYINLFKFKSALFFLLFSFLIFACEESKPEPEPEPPLVEQPKENEPYKVEVVSGNGQLGEPAKKLSNPLIVKVTDSLGRPMSGTLVEWRVKNGNGSLTSDANTNTQGLAEAQWTLGSNGDQEVEVIVKKRNGSAVQGSPILFKAITEYAKDYTIELYKYQTHQKNNVTLTTSTEPKIFRTLRPGDSITVLNQAKYALKLKYKGNYVKVSSYRSQATIGADEYYCWFGTATTTPYRSEDYQEENFLIQLKDVTNNRNIKFPVNAALSNLLYRTVAGKTIEYKYEDKVRMTLQLNKDWSVGGHLITFYTYRLIGEDFMLYKDCSDLYSLFSDWKGSKIEKRVIGRLDYDFKGGSPWGIDDMYIFEDGTATGTPNSDSCRLSATLK